jgi:nucleotide-binding universal stress UspA family protein
MKKLLVPCDGSESALRAVHYAAAQAAAAGSAIEVDLLHVIEPMTPIALSNAFSANRLDDRFPPQAAEVLAPAITVLAQAGVKYWLHCRFGQPATEISTHARDAHCEAVIMGTRGRGALASLVIGSVATQVVKLVDIPVTLVK